MEFDAIELHPKHHNGTTIIFTLIEKSWSKLATENIGVLLETSTSNLKWITAKNTNSQLA